MKQYATLEATVYFWFGANDTSGSGGDGASPAADVRLAGAAADAIPVLSPTPVLLSHANYPAGCYEVAVAATTGNGFAANNTYAVFCTLAIDGQNPTGFIGSVDLKPVEANTKALTDGIITAAKLGADCITNAKIADDAIAVENIKNAAITAAKIAGDAITNAKIADNAIAAEHIADAAIDNATFAADVGSTAYGTNIIALAVRKVLDELNLDHLMKVAVADRDALAEIVDDTVLANLMTKTDGDTSDFDHATDSLEAIRDRGDGAWITGAGGSDRLLMVDTTIATLATQTSFTLTAGSTDDNAYNNCTIVIEDVSTATQKAVGVISDYVGASKTVTLKYDPNIFTMAPTDKVYILAENALKATLANRQLNVAADGDVAGNVDGSVASVAGAVGSVTGAVGSVTADVGITQAGADKAWGTAARVLTAGTNLNDLSAQNVRDAMKLAPSGNGPAAGSVDKHLDDIETDTNEIQGKLPTNKFMGSSDGADDDGNINAILTDTNELQTDNIPGTLSTIAGYLDAEIAAILADTGELQTDWTNGGRLDLLVDAIKARTDRLTDARATELDVGTAGKMAYYMKKIMIACVNKLKIKEAADGSAAGSAEMFSDADVSLGEISAAFATDGTHTTRKRLVI